MAKWRPEGWKDYYRVFQNKRKELGISVSQPRPHFEAGADAMLEAMRGIGDKVDKREAPILYYPLSKGVLVFIPDNDDG